MTTFRDQAQRIAPPWLRGWWGSRLLYALTVPFDGMLDSVIRAVGVRTPGNDDEADLLTGGDRLMVRGPQESSASYASRLRRWRKAHARRGTTFELLRQLSGYLRDAAGVSLPVRAVNNRGDWYLIDAAGVETYGLGTSTWNGGDWDSDTTSWSRFWVIIDCSGRYSRATSLHIGTLDREAMSFGSTMPVSVCAGVSSIVQTWRAAHAVMVTIILAFEDSPALAPSSWARLGDRDGMFNFFGGA